MTKTPDSFIKKNIQNSQEEKKVPILLKGQKNVHELKEKAKNN